MSHQILSPKFFGTILTTLFLLSACGRSKEIVTIIDTEKLAKGSQSNKEKAEQLALAGERLFYTPGAMASDIVFSRALELDSGNTRAKFYKIILTPILLQKGILNRLTPIVANAPFQEREKYFKMIDGLSSDIKQIALDGPRDIDSEDKLQGHIESTQNAFIDMAKGLDGLGDQVLTVNAYFYEDSASHRVECWKNGPTDTICYVYETRNSKWNSASVRLDFYDFKAMSLMAKAQALYAVPALSYSMTGSIKVFNKLYGTSPELITAQLILGELAKEKQVLTLKDLGQLKKIQNFGVELLEVYDIAVKNQPVVCSSGKNSSENRPGMLFSAGFCITNVVVNASDMLRQALVGPVEVRDNGFVTTVNVNSFLNGGITDLKALAPDQYNPCGDATSMPDYTVGGLLPRGDLVQVARRYQDHDFLSWNCPK